MNVDLCAERTIDSPRDAVFALALDPERFPEAFPGYGPIPAIRSITLHAPPAVGSTRELHNSDGSRPLERITALDPPHLHAYELSRLRAPFSWLVRTGNAEWTFAPHDGGTRVVWRYRFELAGALAWPLAWPLLKGFMAGAMRRCLANMARMLESTESLP